MRSVKKIATTALLAAYPFAMWAGVSTLGIRVVGWGLLGALIVSAVAGLRRPRSATRMGTVLGRLGLAAVAGLGILLDEERLLLLMPVLINATMLFVFGRSLLGGRPTIVERFARASGENLTEGHVAYYRRVTAIWCWFFVGNGLLTLWLVLFGSLAAWGIYTGLIAYVLVGILFGGESIVRRLRFG
jgi:uncharacterized membrane protein